ncbi:MAG: hypothetical protein B5766_00705 [Candidatus Lumbricidophila eiseniae]|uniref:Integrase catalytic domain-containing protein n=1 Tax=Candidatus Lumbricidiphila eiseniae TaxID=1969409 RepID=A0A2A6FUW9_9MICO|nr:MAG: hypothetical protein B5766_00705 [Candidatus Lumbricidophila eiseniae]
MPAAVAARLLQLRRTQRLGRDKPAHRVGLSPSTASRIIARAALPALHELDPVTGIRIRASRRTQLRYEHQQPGTLVHIDVKKLARIPDNGRWRLDGPDTTDHNRGQTRSAKPGMNYIHVTVEDHSRLAFAHVLPNEKDPTCATFLAKTAKFFASHRIRIRQVMTNNALNYPHSHDFQTMLAALQTNTHPDPTTPALTEQQSRTLQPHPARRMSLPVALHPQPETQQRPHTLAQPLQPHPRPHHPRRPTPNHPTVTNEMTEYT